MVGNSQWFSSPGEVLAPLRPRPTAGRAPGPPRPGGGPGGDAGGYGTTRGRTVGGTVGTGERCGTWGKFMGNSWENMGKYGKMIGKSENMGKCRKIFGKIIGQIWHIWENVGQAMGK